MIWVYVGNLGNKGFRWEFECEFERYGFFCDVWVVWNFLGFVFILYEDLWDVDDVICEMDGKLVCGEWICVEFVWGFSCGGRVVWFGLMEKCFDCGRVGYYVWVCICWLFGGSWDCDWEWWCFRLCSLW